MPRATWTLVSAGKMLIWNAFMKTGDSRIRTSEWMLNFSSWWPAYGALLCVGSLASFPAKHDSEAAGPEGIARPSLIDRLASLALRERVMHYRKSEVLCTENGKGRNGTAGRSKAGCRRRRVVGGRLRSVGYLWGLHLPVVRPLAPLDTTKTTLVTDCLTPTPDGNQKKRPQDGGQL